MYEFKVWDKKNKKMAKVMNSTFRSDIECVHYSDNGGVYLINKEDYILLKEDRDLNVKEFKMVDSVMTTEQKKQILAMNKYARELARRWKK